MFRVFSRLFPVLYGVQLHGKFRIRYKIGIIANYLSTMDHGDFYRPFQQWDHTYLSMEYKIVNYLPYPIHHNET